MKRFYHSGCSLSYFGSWGRGELCPRKKNVIVQPLPSPKAWAAEVPHFLACF